jgi:bifunctional polynucleotide phosphatase/kinase
MSDGYSSEEPVSVAGSTDIANYWKETKGLLFYYNRKFLGNYLHELDATGSESSDECTHDCTLPRIKEIYDLDNTLIRTKSGNKIAENEDDWQFLPGVEEYFEKVAESSNYFLIILANQGSLRASKETDKVSSFKRKINTIANTLADIFAKKQNELYVLCAFSLDQHDIVYRKPFSGMWELLQTCIPFKESLVPITYIGDAAGRRSDSSCIDRKFAVNARMNFISCDAFFDNEYSADNDDYFSWGFDPRVYLRTPCHLPNSKEQLPNISELFDKEQNYLVLLVGYPGSGKTTLAKHIIANNPSIKFTTISESVYGSNIEAAQKQIYKSVNNNSIIIDYCNASILDRNSWIMFTTSINANIKVYLFEMTTPKELSVHLNVLKYRKKKQTNNSHSSRQYTAYDNNYEPVDQKNEGIDEYYRIPFMPAFDNNGKKILDFLLFTS